MESTVGRRHGYAMFDNISRVSDQNGVSLLYIVLEIHHSGREPWICTPCDHSQNIETEI